MATRVKLVMKTCSKCGLLLPASEFNRDRSKRDGLDTYCRVCRYEYMRTYDQKEQAKRYSTPESRDAEFLAMMRKRYAEESWEPPYEW